MATTIQQIEAGALNALASAIQSNSTAVEGYIATGEADLKTALVNLIKDIPAVKGAASILVGPLESAAESALTSYVDGLIAKETPASILALVVSFLQSKAKQLSA